MQFAAWGFGVLGCWVCLAFRVQRSLFRAEPFFPGPSTITCNLGPKLYWTYIGNPLGPNDLLFQYLDPQGIQTMILLLMGKPVTT